MRWGFTLQIIGLILCFVGLSMLLPLGVAVYYHEATVAAFSKSISLITSLGVLLFVVFRRHTVEAMTHREGMAVVTLGWIGSGLFGALPFFISGQVPHFTDCVFETFSGFTTTGASILPDIEALPKSLLFWRSLTHWLGGMGIILLSLAILPFLGVGGMQLYKAEVPGPTPDKLRPRIKDTALLLWKVYLIFSVLEVLLLIFGGMDLYHALCHTFGTMATGGFSPKAASIGHYESLYFDLVITVFMFIAGTNFALHFKLLQGRPGAFWKDTEFKAYSLVVLGVTAAVTFTIWGEVYAGFWQSVRYSLFQVVSIVTTTGYVTADYESWGPLPQVLLFLCMFLGGSAGSTGGGIKCMRIIILVKHVWRELLCLVHPHAVVPVKFGGKIVSEDVLRGIWGFLFLYLFLAAASAVVLAALGVDVLTSFAAVIACISNIGPGLAQVGPMDSYAHLPALGKWVLSFCMLLGRLEIYTVIILLFSEFWRK